MKTKSKLITLVVSLVVIAAILVVCSLAVTAPETHECHACDGTGICPDCGGDGCGSCYDLIGKCSECGGEGFVKSESRYSETFISLLPPVIAIALALITKEVYSSLFVGIVVGAFLFANYSFTGAMDVIINDAIVSAVADSAGIFVFLVVLGIVVSLVNKAGGSQAFGKWAKTHIKSKTGAILATFALGVLIFIDDYFNCLTVGSVMAPVTDAHKISRVKLAYLIDATAAPVCMIAPVSSWAAAVSQYAEDGQGLKLFVSAIPFNFYSLLTLVFIIALAILGFDYGKMADFEFEQTEETEKADAGANGRGRVIDLIFPIIVLVVSCVIGLVYVGGFFDKSSGNYLDFIGAFGDTDAFVGLPWGSIIALVIIIAYLLIRRVVTATEAMESIPAGFNAMVPAILILTFATALKNITTLLGAKYFVAGIMANSAAGLSMFLPAVIFLVACGLAFATGTSWGTFGILIPIVTAIFSAPEQSELMIVGISACLAGAVCGDHCSPISDTTIMSSAGAQCNHVDHVSTQLPYAISVAAISFVMYIIAGVIPNAWICLPIGIVLTVGFLVVMKFITKKKRKAN